MAGIPLVGPGVIAKGPAVPSNLAITIPACVRIKGAGQLVAGGAEFGGWGLVLWRGWRRTHRHLLTHRSRVGSIVVSHRQRNRECPAGTIGVARIPLVGPGVITKGPAVPSNLAITIPACVRIKRAGQLVAGGAEFGGWGLVLWRGWRRTHRHLLTHRSRVGSIVVSHAQRHRECPAGTI